MTSRRIVFTTFGSLGDLHPYMAIALSLKEKGHHPIIATLNLYRKKVEAAGIEFHLLRSTLVERPDQELIRQVLDLRKGGEFLVRQLLMPAIKQAYADTLAAAEKADLLVSHPLTMATRLTAETTGIKWVSTQLAPIGFLSAFDPPVLPQAPFLTPLRFLGPNFFRPVFAQAKRVIVSWIEPYFEFRKELGLADASDPLFEGGSSPEVVLALFSEVLAKRQPDWPTNTVVTGFPFFDQDTPGGLPMDLERFLDAGSPPIVFTLGTSAVLDPGSFYQDSAEAARRLGKRAVLITGRFSSNGPRKLSKDAAVFDYAPFSRLFPRAAVIVHQGGVGTTAQAMRAGRPMLVMPYALDQPDNAARLKRLGVAHVVPRRQYSAERCAAELDRILRNTAIEKRAREVRAKMVSENGAMAACAGLLALLM